LVFYHDDRKGGTFHPNYIQRVKKKKKIIRRLTVGVQAVFSTQKKEGESGGQQLDGGESRSIHIIQDERKDKHTSSHVPRGIGSDENWIRKKRGHRGHCG